MSERTETTPDGRKITIIGDAPDWALAAIRGGIPGRMSEAAPCPDCATSDRELCRVHRIERVTVAELAAGDVIENADGSRAVVGYVGPVERIGPRSYRYVSGTGMTSGSWRTSNRYDRLTDTAKRLYGYPTAEHDVPSVREPRETCERCAAMDRALRRTNEPGMSDTERAGLHRYGQH